MITEGLRSLARQIDSVTLLPGNPRKGDIEAVKRSLARFGQMKPIVATPDLTVIAGNHTLIAARELGWDEIAVHVVDLDSEEAKAYALADNRVGDLGSYDSEALAELLIEVAVDPDLLLATGYTEADLDALLTQPADSIDDSEFDTIDPDEIDTQYRCPSCNYEWSGSPRPGEPLHDRED